LRKLALSLHTKESGPCRTLAVIDDVYCIFIGMLENLPMLRQRYGLTKTVNEVALIIEMYRSLRDRGSYSADQVIGDLVGSFAFVLYDNKERKLLVASVSTPATIPLLWKLWYCALCCRQVTLILLVSDTLQCQSHSRKPSLPVCL
jgi:hypothetical protein